MKRNSLIIRYLLIVLTAFMMWPLVFPASFILYQGPHAVKEWLAEENGPANPYSSRQELISRWHQEARQLDGALPEAIDEALARVKKELPQARLFWVDGDGLTRLALTDEELPAQWSAAEGIAFMKRSYDADPFTVVAFIGQKQEQGFMALQVDQALMRDKPAYGLQQYFITLSTVFVIFLAISWLFFYRIRKRLVGLARAMETVDEAGIPHPVEVGRGDEIGELERAFNEMTGQLHAGRRREAREETLRKELIASLSHDLRTPITIIRSHAYSLRKEELPAQALQSAALIEGKAEELSRLMDNLLSYSLLSAGKLPQSREAVEMGRFLRTAAAQWYPVLEERGFRVEVDTPEHPVIWHTDPQWMTRILDNLLQNVARHAGSGGYAGLSLGENNGRSMMVVEDRGPGMAGASDKKGAGIGLEIVALMCRELGISFQLESGSGGTRACLGEPGTGLNEI
ncbi:HAMP domain-containing sensor histidine kinase [Paenibacillus sp. YN15]|uniref:sensor histidine kinase n=1 Tax=Paenibacillus sp. YN15 TaxID=1742774 RepID=UPI000DCC2917|nr:HAMP domain-containing sensor histidine kinase [Paenibacillus sp. YN15]RAU99571.1 sensor histidine kinase [Paenibacillus sp. YN15]